WNSRRRVAGTQTSRGNKHSVTCDRRYPPPESARDRSADHISSCCRAGGRDGPALVWGTRDFRGGRHRLKVFITEICSQFPVSARGALQNCYPSLRKGTGIIWRARKDSNLRPPDS